MTTTTDQLSDNQSLNATVFGALPLEILQRIITSGTCRTAIALSQVNHRLHDICQDPLIFRHIVEAGNGSSGQRSSAWWSNSPLDSITDASTAARWALADLKAIQLVQGSEGPANLDEKCIAWLPQLLAYHHPVFPYAPLDNIDALISHIGLNTYIGQSLSFCASIKMLQMAHDDPISTTNYPPSIGMFGLIRDRLSNVFRTSTTPLGQLGQGMQYFPEDVSSIKHETEASQIHGHANFAVGIIGYELRQTIKSNRLRRNGGTRTNCQPPMPDNIPFATFMDFTAPFSEPSTDFRTSHIPKMTSPEFLSDGEWVGYYCYSFQGQSPVFDSMMHRIQFVVTPLEDDFVQVEALDGIDGVGAFTIRGRLSRQTGLVTLVKTYGDGGSWTWRAAMTPFGIAGVWGSHGWGGWFWLFKKAWSSS